MPRYVGRVQLTHDQILLIKQYKLETENKTKKSKIIIGE